MHHDLVNLLGALRDQPEDDVAFLALADWCQEQPDEATRARGEHVRLSLELSKLARPESSSIDYLELAAARKGLQGQMKALERRHRVAWLGTIRDMAHRCDFLPGGLLRVEFSGGRADQAREARVPPPRPADFLWVSELEARNVSASALRWLAATLPAGCVRSFSADSAVGDGPPPEFVIAAGFCPWLNGLRELALRCHSLDVPGCVALLGRPSLAHLRALNLSACGLAASDLRVLVELPVLAGVRRLDLSYNPLGNEGMVVLAGSPHLRGLRELQLRSCGIRGPGLSTLCAAPFGQLESLDVSDNACLCDAGLLELCQSAALSRLRRFVCETRSWEGPTLRPETYAALRARFGESLSL